MKSKLTWEKVLEHLPAKILALGAAILLFLFNRIDAMQERFFSIPVRVTTESGLTPGENYAHRVKVTLRGAEEVIFPIQEEEIEATVDFSSHNTEGVYRAPIRIIRKGSALDAQNLEITVEPIEMTLKLDKKLAKSLEVIPKFSGQPSRGFEMDSYKITPSFVTVEGPAARVEKLTQARTENVDLRGRNENFNARVRLLNEDSLVSYPGGNTVEFQGLIRPMVSTMAWESLPVTPHNLQLGLKLTRPLGEVKLRLKGNQGLLDSLKGQSSLLYVDLAEITKPGEFKLKVESSLPSEVEILELVPQTVNVTLERIP